MVPELREAAWQFVGNLRVQTLRLRGARHCGSALGYRRIIDDAINIFGIADGYLTPM